MLRDGAKWLARKRRQLEGLPAVYQRSGETVNVTVSPGATAYETANAEGAAIRATATDWIIRASQLVLSGLHATPQRGDTIAVAWPDGVRRYEVMPLDLDGECYRLDMHRTQFRIHTRMIEDT